MARDSLPAPFQILINHIRKRGLPSTLGRLPEAIACVSPLAYRNVSRALALPCTAKLKKYHPGIALKYFGNYLSAAFNARVRAAILANHYRFLNEHVSGHFIHDICEGQIQLWRQYTDIGDLRITLTYPADSEKEGDLSLLLWHESRLIFTTSFTIAPGKHLDLAENQVIFVGRLQGARVGTQIFREIAKSLHEVSPPALLLAAIQGIASTFSISSIVGVSACAQICLIDNGTGSDAHSVYDAFWKSVGAQKLGRSMYYLPAGAEEKPLSQIKSNHRSRVKRKRQFKRAVMDQVAIAFKENCLARREPLPVALLELAAPGVQEFAA